MKGLKLVATLLLFVGCFGWGDIEPPSEPVTEAELVGTYAANYMAGLTETIELRTDSTYIYYFKSKDGKEHIDTNYWELHREGGDSSRPRIWLYDFSTRYPLEFMCFSKDVKAELDTTRRDYHPYVFKRGSRIALKRCPNRNQYYIKQK